MTTTQSLGDITQENTFHWKSIDEIDLQALKQAFDKHTFACIRGLIDPKAVEVAKKALRQHFDPAKDHPSHGESPDAVKQNFQKLAVGGAMQCGVYRPRFFRTLYNPLWAPNIYKMHDLFRTLCKVRNTLMGKPLDYAIDTTEDGLWTASRIHQYPRGGGFLVSHRDTVLNKVANEAGMEYYQIFLMMTKQGKDYDQGGGFVEVNGERLLFEEYFEVGDILMYDGRTTHGVMDIDPHCLPDYKTLSGRLVAFVTWYKDLAASA